MFPTLYAPSGDNMAKGIEFQSMATRGSRRKRPKIRIWWENPPGSLGVTVERMVGSRSSEREVGPRGLVDLDEASVISRLPVEFLRKAIRAGDLRARQGRVVLKDLDEFVATLHEDLYDLAVALSREREPTIPAAEVYRRLGL